MKHKLIISELLAVLVAGMYLIGLTIYFYTGNKFVLFFEYFWFIVLFGFCWYGMYKRFEVLENEENNK